VDLALLEIDDLTVDLPPLPIARVDRAGTDAEIIERVQVVGYPQFAERPAVGRETAHAAGHIPVLAGLVSGLLTVQLTSAPRPLPDPQVALGQSQWSGISGAPVLAGGCLLGVVSEHAARDGPSAITAVPLTLLDPDPVHPRWGAGVTNPAQWWARIRVTDPAALSQLPARSERTPPEYWSTLREIHDRTPQLVGRQAELAKIAAFATGPPGYRWLVGDAWAGKTALLAEFVVAALPPEVDVVAYFASRREADADGNLFLTAVVPQLEDLLDEDRSTRDRHRLRYLWDRAVERATTADRQLLLVVDGLDEDLRPQRVPSIASLLPARLGPRGHVLVASRPHPKLPADVDAEHPLRTTNRVALSPSREARHLATLAEQELDDLLRGEQAELAAEVFGVLTAAAGPLAGSFAHEGL
jgi:NACHT domain